MNGYQKAVTPASVSSPDMSTTGNKTVTVTFTYNGKTCTTTYDITVSIYRKVMESQEENVVLSWTSNTNPTATPSDKGITGTKSGSTYYDTDVEAFRLGTSSNSGQVTINSSTYSLTSLKVNAKYYGSDSSAKLNVNGTSIGTLTNSFKDFTVAVSGKEVTLSSLNSSNKRVNIKQITIYFIGPETDIGQSEDCVGLETFITNYMHMDYTESLGYCSDSTHHYYSTAKQAFNQLNEHQRSLFVGNSAYSAEYDRLSTWAAKNGEAFNQNNTLAQNNLYGFSQNIQENHNIFAVIIIISTLSVTAVGVCFFIRKKREN